MFSEDVVSETIVVTLEEEHVTREEPSRTHLYVKWLYTLSCWSVYLLLFLLPIACLPWVAEPLEGIKQTLLVVFTSTALVGWLSAMVVGQRLSWRGGWASGIPALVLLSIVFSAAGSLAGYTTWIGGAAQEYVSVLTAAACVALFYVLSNLGGTRIPLNRAFFALLLSAACSGILTVLGLLTSVHLPFAFAQVASFNTVGTIQQFGFFLLAVFFLGLTTWVIWPVSETGEALLGGLLGKGIRWLIAVVGVCTLFVLLAADFWILWTLSVVGVLFLLSVGFLRGSEFPRPTRFFVPFGLLVVSLLFFFLPSPVQIPLPVVVSPNYISSWDIAKQTLAERPGRLLFGSGPGTYAYNYARWKPAAVNNSAFWSVSFDRAKSHILTLLATLGIVGTTLWVLFLAVLGTYAFARLAFERHLGDWKTAHALFVPWVIVVVGHLFYSSNMTLQFLLWVFSGLLAGQVWLRVRSRTFAQAPRIALVASFAFVSVSVVTLMVLVLASQRVAADLAFARAVRLDPQGGQVDQVITELTRASSMSPLLHNALYQRHLSAAYLAKARILLQQAGETPSTEQWKGVSDAVFASVEAAKTAVAWEPGNVTNWVMLGSVYRDVLPFSSGAERVAVAAFEHAVALEPLNPSHVANVGRVHIAVADRARQLKGAEDATVVAEATQIEKKELVAAEEAFNQAIALKQDYAAAHYYLASVYERQGRLEEATTRMGALSRYRPDDIGLGFQYAMLLLRLGNLDLARGELERQIVLAPNNSNALWYLSAIYEKQGDASRALALAEQVLQLNPQNTAVQARVDALRTGASAPTLPEPVETP